MRGDEKVVDYAWLYQIGDVASVLGLGSSPRDLRCTNNFGQKPMYIPSAQSQIPLYGLVSGASKIMRRSDFLFQTKTDELWRKPTVNPEL